jgi:hypothetical protein
MTAQQRQRQRSAFRRLKLCVTAVVISGLVLIACGRRYYGEYRRLVAANRVHTQSLELGMDQRQVAQVMADGAFVSYKKIQVTNPYRSEGFALDDGTSVQILFYLTQVQRRYGRPTNEELTPVVMENRKLVGWGWSFLDKNLERYQVKLPY